MYWLITISWGGSFTAASTGQTWALANTLKKSWGGSRKWYKNHLNANLSAGNSVWKSLEILGVTFGIFNIRATISFPCHFPRYKVPEWDCAIAFDKLNDLMSTPVYLDKVASRVLVFVPFQFSSLYGIFCLVFWPFSAAISTNMNFYGTI